MTAPRQVLPGKTYLVTRRCARREFLLRPSELTNAIFSYVLAVAARRYGLLVHAFCVMSNHFHLVVTDPGAQLPAFEQYLNSLVARAVNASLGRWEAFWAPSSYSAVALGSAADILDKAAYVLANPVAAGLVRRAVEWPGLWSSPQSIGGAPLRSSRPKEFFRAGGYMPEIVELQLVAPPGFASAAEFREQLEAALAEREAAAQATIASSGGGVLGASAVCAQRPEGRPAGAEPRRGLNPRVGVRDKWKRIEALRRVAEFVAEYRAALAAWRAGMRSVLFPAGTYLMRITHGACCAAP